MFLVIKSSFPLLGLSNVIVMSKKHNQEESLIGYSKYFLIQQNEFRGNKLRAKLFNLVDATLTDETQRASFKGLIRDFTAEAHYGLNRDIYEYLQYLNVMDENEGVNQSLLQENPVLSEV